MSSAWKWRPDWSRWTSTAPCCAGCRVPARPTRRSRRRRTTPSAAPVEAGAHIVLASGRSPHGMTRIADLLGLPLEGDEPLWVVASNGAVIFRYPPVEVVHEETFDAGPGGARRCSSTTPTRWSPSRSAGVGYRVNRPFPDGELSGEMILTDVDDLVAGPVSRVIIRDPEATADDFVELAARLGLHGTDYVVGWTAWLDLAPVGVSKASGLEIVARELRPRGRRRAGHRRRPQRHRDAALGRSRGGDGPGHRRRSARPPTPSRRRCTTTARPSSSTAGSVVADPRLVATDLDGTLVHSDGSLTPRTREVLAALEAAASRSSLVTARPMRWMDELWPLVGRVGLGVVSNGAIVYDVAARPPVPGDRHRRGRGPGAGRGHPGRRTRGDLRARVRLRPQARPAVRRAARRAAPGSPVAELEELWTEPAVKVMVRCPAMEPADLLARTDRGRRRARHRVVDDRGPGRDRAARRHQGHHPRRGVRRARVSTRPTWWPSGTCPTTSRC